MTSIYLKSPFDVCSRHISPLNPSKGQKIYAFVKECIIKEFGSCLRALWNRTVYWINPHIHNLNPVQISTNKIDQKAKVVLLLHAMGSHPSSFVPLAKKLNEAHVKNVYTVSLNQTDQDPVPTDALANRIEKITQIFQQHGYKHVEFTLIGHSLGALVASKYIWRVATPIENSSIARMISIAGRLKYIQNEFAWFCEDVKPEINKTYDAIIKDPTKVSLYTIWGDEDAIVPRASAHIQGDPTKETTVKGWGHGGIIYAPKTHEAIVSILAG